jgi:hypothetical protein
MSVNYVSSELFGRTLRRRGRAAGLDSRGVDDLHVAAGAIGGLDGIPALPVAFLLVASHEQRRAIGQYLGSIAFMG